MFYLSKSKYCNFWQCPKMAWLNKYKPKEKTEDPNLEILAYDIQLFKWE